MKDLIKKKYVYESPDGGTTVYAREVGSTKRRLIQSPPLRQQLQKQQVWRNILAASETDNELRYLLEQAEIYWRMKYDSDN